MAAAAAAKAAAAALSAGAAFAVASERVHAGLFSSSSPAPAPGPGAPLPSQQPPAPAAEERPKFRNDNPRTTAAGFDPAPLERAVELLDRIGKNPGDARRVGFPSFGGKFRSEAVVCSLVLTLSHGCAVVRAS